VFLSKQQTRVAEAFAVERVAILEDLAQSIHRDVLGQDLLALLLE
jgi:hypothetical protein